MESGGRKESRNEDNFDSSINEDNVNDTIDNDDKDIKWSEIIENENMLNLQNLTCSFYSIKLFETTSSRWSFGCSGKKY